MLELKNKSLLDNTRYMHFFLKKMFKLVDESNNKANKFIVLNRVDSIVDSSNSALYPVGSRFMTRDNGKGTGN